MLMVKPCTYLKLTTMLRIAGLRARPWLWHGTRSRLLLLLLLTSGCTKRQPASTNSAVTTDQSRPSVTLRVLVVNEPELAEAIDRLRGEWNDRSRGELNTSSMSWAELAAANSPDADVIVFPSRYLGELCSHSWLRPVRSNVLQSDELKMSDVFPVVGRQLIRWGGEVMCLPLGIDPATVRPNSAKHPAIGFLVEAAPEATSQNREGVLFDTQTMKPRITEPVFVESLQRLTNRVDNSTNQSSDDGPIPVLGYGDRLVAVTATSRNAASAFKLLAWIAQPDISSQIASAGGGSLPVRRSLATSKSGYGPHVTAEHKELAKALEVTLSGEQYLLVPRIPGVDDYMSALDEAVKSATFDKVPAQQALNMAAQSWEQITDARGLEAQRQAHLKHLNIGEP
jgi:hypothetical protein